MNLKAWLCIFLIVFYLLTFGKKSETESDGLIDMPLPTAETVTGGYTSL